MSRRRKTDAINKQVGDLKSIEEKKILQRFEWWLKTNADKYDHRHVHHVGASKYVFSAQAGSGADIVHFFDNWISVHNGYCLHDGKKDEFIENALAFRAGSIFFFSRPVRIFIFFGGGLWTTVWSVGLGKSSFQNALYPITTFLPILLYFSAIWIFEAPTPGEDQASPGRHVTICQYWSKLGKSLVDFVKAVFEDYNESANFVLKDTDWSPSFVDEGKEHMQSVRN